MADNTFITAWIGGGKSLLGTRVLVDELEHGERMISTSLPLFIDDHWHRVPKTKRMKPPAGIPSWWLPELMIREVDGQKDSMEIWVYGLATWSHYEIKKPVDLNHRLRLLKHEEISKFYLHLPNKDISEYEEHLPGRKPVWLPRLEERGQDGGCLFMIDEIHNYFSARNYLEAGPGVERYQSQLRKLNDDMWMISQHLEKVDKNFRRNATKTYELSNLGQQRLFAGVTIKERFNWKLYAGVPQRGDKATDKGSFMLRERGICYLYDTMAGVGVTGGIKPDAPRAGRHWTTWVLLALVICVVAVILPRAIMRGFGYGMGHMLSSVQNGVTKGFHKQTNTLIHENDKTQTLSGEKPASVGQIAETTAGEVPQAKPAGVEQSQAGTNNALTCTGYVVMPDRSAIAFLSDGSSCSSADGSLVGITKRLVVTTLGVFPVKTRLPNYTPQLEQTVTDQVLPELERPSVPSSVVIVGQNYRNSLVRMHERHQPNYNPSQNFQRQSSSVADVGQGYPVPPSLDVRPQTENGSTVYNF